MMKSDAFQTQLLDSALELAHLLREHHQLLEKQIYDQGSGIVGVFKDSNFKDSFQNSRDLRIDILKNAIEDLSLGGGRLISSTMGISFSKGKLISYIEEFGSAPEGSVIFSISLKQRAAFQNWRNGDDPDSELSQDEVNAAIYRLTVELSEIL
jgi:hypothetical protein